MKRIQDKLQQLLKQQAALQKENALLKEEVNGFREKSSQYHSTIETLKQQVDISKFSNGEMDDEERRQFEKRINTYLKEIDRCIAMLSE